MKSGLIVPSIIFSLALVASASLVRDSFDEYLSTKQTLKVTGSAHLDFESDLGFLRGSISAASSNLTAAYNDLQRQVPLVRQFFSSRGIAEENIRFFPASRSSEREYDKNGKYTGKILRHNYYQRFEVQSGNVKQIESLATELPSIVQKSVYVTVDSPEYVYSKLNEKKVEVQALAAKDAMQRADKISQATGRSLGVMRNARMGVLQITPRHSNQISDYGMNDTSSIEKKITAVVSATFSINAE